ncbi:MAG: arginase family protein [Alphaproteobacteria bacterium]|nr:arginase family protein [Alphaproteobacteria bacterium]
MNNIMGIEYGRGCLRTAIDGGPALAPAAIKQMFPNADWTTVVADPFDAAACQRDRFGENFQIQRKIYAATPDDAHIMIGGDHSVNYGHFVALRDRMPNEELCLVYIDAHLDIHTPETAFAQASGAPHGTNVRALLGDGDARWLSLQRHAPALRPDRLFYLGTRSYEPAEIKYARDKNIFIRTADELTHPTDWHNAVSEIRRRIDERPFVVSFDFDEIDPKLFHDVLVPAVGGISVDAAEYFIRAFDDAHSFEFVEYAPSGDRASAEIVKRLVGLVVDA